MKLHPLPLCCTLDTPLGDMVLAASDRGLVGAWFVGQRHAPDWVAWPSTATPEDHPTLAAAARQLLEYFHQQRRTFELPLDLGHGTAFQQQVWQALLGIPAGHTATYGQLAAQLCHPTASRAVGAAVGRNPVSIVVPCHRVLGAQGRLTGYAGGLDKKVALLQLESTH
ncbi:MAG: cysteine methyltransferase [Polaromonas sp.]|nr:cysteine methyltransferase [Polaromonas sp.]